MTTATPLRRFLAYLHRGGVFGYYWLNPGKRSIWWPVDEPAALPSNRVNVYFGVHPTTAIPPADRHGNPAQPEAVRGQIGYIAAINCLFGEYDAKDYDGDRETARAAVDVLDPPPSIVIASGGGYHCYWLLDQPYHLDTPAAREHAKELQARWVGFIGSDAASKDLARVLRVPGTQNYKYRPAPVITFVRADYDCLYALDDLEAVLPPAEVVEEPPILVAVRAQYNGHTDFYRDFAMRKLAHASTAVATAPDGQKHITLRDQARLLGGLVPHRLLTNSEIENTLFGAIAARAQDRRNAMQTIRDGINYGEQAPLELPTPPPEPVFDNEGFACCPTHQARLIRSKNGNGWRCPTYDCFWWKGDGYAEPQSTGAATNAPIAPTPASVLTTANMTDAGNAECFAALYGATFRYCPQLAGKGKERWLAWDGARWIMDEGGAAQRAMLETMRLRYQAAWNIDDKDLAAKAAKWALGSESMQRRKAALESARSIAEMVVHIGQIDVDPFLAAVQNGTLELRTGTLRTSRADDYLMQRLGTRYDPEATCPRWRAFLGEVFNNDTALIAYIQRAVGYSLTGDTREQKWFLCFGKGSNGKGVFLRVLAWLMGDYAGNASFETFDAAKRSESTNDLAALKGKRLVTISETDEDRRLSEARMKQATGEDPITCRFLYNEQFTYIPAFKIWMIVNHLPIMRDSGDGNWRRPQLVPFTQSFLGREDFTLKPALYKELPGILNWALEGLRAWQREGLGSAPAVVAATQKHRQDSDTVGLWLSDYAIDEHGAVLPALEAYKDYGEWSDERGMRYPLSYMSWQRAMSDRGYRADRHRSDGRRIAVFLGVRKRTDADDAAEEDTQVDGVDGVVNGFSENSRNSNSTKRVFRKTTANPVHPVQTEDTPPSAAQLERVPEAKRTIIRMYLRSGKDSDQARARELCEEYGLDYETARAEVGNQ